MTVILRPHVGQKRGGSRARSHPEHSVVERPHPVQWDDAAVSPVFDTQIAALRAPMGMRRSSSIWMSSLAERPSVVR